MSDSDELDKTASARSSACPAPESCSAAYTHLPNIEYKVLGVG